MKGSQKFTIKGVVTRVAGGNSDYVIIDRYNYEDGHEDEVLSYTIMNYRNCPNRYSVNEILEEEVELIPVEKSGKYGKIKSYQLKFPDPPREPMPWEYDQ